MASCATLYGPQSQDLHYIFLSEEVSCGTWEKEILNEI